VPAPSATLTIAVIPKGTTHSYWNAVHAGAVQAQADLKAVGENVDILWEGTTNEDDHAGQVAIMRAFTDRPVSGIVLAPQDAQALVASVDAAAGAGIPVVVIDSGLDSKKPVSFVATDNRKAGELAAQRMILLLRGKGKVIMLRYLKGSASTEAREAGFLDGIRKAPGITVMSSDRYAGPTMNTGHLAASDLLKTYGNAVDGVFASNESSSRGMLQGLEEAGKTGKVQFVAFDSDPVLIAGLKSGHVQALVVQNPFHMGYLGVKTVVQAIRKEQAPASIDTGAAVVTLDHLNSPDIQRLLNPPAIK